MHAPTPVLTKLGGLVGAVLLMALVITGGDRIDWTADITNDYLATSIIVAAGVIGALSGSQLVRRLRDRHAGRSASTGLPR